ncbi:MULTISPECIES: winged helix-turn-helix domain-containing protein [Halomonas]|uniref:Two-component system response regulator RstA n=1 Tax=Halomonas ventosae TaxID=229007 RepID=A0A4R6HI25_9GAMM|nr:winged helix-turn-helix domain-containing protein [Halomonas ventosae]TDO07711.1 two-component system response regulator RstA [Halomonas ventosae]
MDDSLQTQEQEHVLIIEDDERLADLTRDYLEANGFRVTVEADGARGVERILALQPELVILDLMLPGEDGLSICRRVRSEYPGPIMMLTARTDDMDQVLGLEMGADDYVPKPVQPRVLLARMRALLRRAEPAEASEETCLTFADLVIDNTTREACMDGERVDLTSAEFDLLWLLASNAGRVLTREEIFERLRGIKYDGQDRSIDVRVSRIRPKIGDDPNQPHRIKTVRSKGYLFVRDG